MHRTVPKDLNDLGQVSSALMFESLEISLKSQQIFARMASSKEPVLFFGIPYQNIHPHLQFKIFLKRKRHSQNHLGLSARQKGASVFS